MKGLENMLINCLVVGVGGFIGSVLRYLVGLIPFLQRGDVPFQTLIVNVFGAIFIGILVKSADSCSFLHESMLLCLKVGVCGGFTTFSTFSLEALGFLENGKILLFLFYVCVTVILCILGVYVGKSLVH